MLLFISIYVYYIYLMSDIETLCIRHQTKNCIWCMTTCRGYINLRVTGCSCQDVSITLCL